MGVKGKFFLLTAVQAAARLVFLLLMYMGVMRTPVLLLPAALVLFLMILPGNFLFSGMYRKDENVLAKFPVQKAVKLGIYRGISLLCWAPLIAFSCRTMNAYNQGMSVTAFHQYIKQFSFLVFSEKATDSGAAGLLMAFVLLGAFALVCSGLNRSMEYLKWTGNEKAGDLGKKAWILGRKYAKRLGKVHGVNGLLALPGVVLSGAVLLKKLFFTGSESGLFALMQKVLRLVTEPLNAGQIITLILIWFAVYTPLLMLRKMRLCKAVIAIEKEMGE